MNELTITTKYAIFEISDKGKLKESKDYDGSFLTGYVYNRFNSENEALEAIKNVYGNRNWANHEFVILPVIHVYKL